MLIVRLHDLLKGLPSPVAATDYDNGRAAFEALEAVNASVGLDPVSLSEREAELSGFLGDSNNPYLSKYTAVIAMVHTLFGDDLSDRKIVEVGPNNDGIPVLGYFCFKGAESLGIDTEQPGDRVLSKYPNVSFKAARWEDIEKCVDGKPVDVVYTQGMCPNPENGGKFEGDSQGFEKHIANEIDKILAPGGVYIGREMGSDYALSDEQFKRMGYKIHTFEGPKLSMLGDFPTTPYEKEKWRIYLNSPEFGKCLRVYQKPSV